MEKRSKILGIILARKGSKRLKNKHLIIVNDKPLIQYTFEYAKQSAILDDLICSTDCEEIEALASSFNIQTIKRPRELARDDSHIIEAIKYTLVKYYEEKKYLPEVTVNLYGNIPYRKTPIEKGIELFYKKGADSVFTACKVLKYHPEWMFKSDSENQIIFEKKSLNYRCQDLPDYYIVTDAFIISRTERLLQEKPRESLYSDFGERLFFVKEEMNNTIEVDDINDLNLFHFFLLNEKQKGKLFYEKT